jgi:hypothetical protein
LAEQHGVCIRPLAMRRLDTTTGRVEIIPVPCGSTRRSDAAHVRTSTAVANGPVPGGLAPRR